VAEVAVVVEATVAEAEVVETGVEVVVAEAGARILDKINSVAE